MKEDPRIHVVIRDVVNAIKNHRGPAKDTSKIKGQGCATLWQCVRQSSSIKNEKRPYIIYNPDQW
jgi:hypothetical protein